MKETLIHSSSQAGFAILDAVQGANRRRSGATAWICNAAMRQNSQMAAARGIDQRFLKETLLHSSGQAGFAVLEAVQGAKIRTWQRREE